MMVHRLIFVRVRVRLRFRLRLSIRVRGRGWGKAYNLLRVPYRSRIMAWLLYFPYIAVLWCVKAVHSGTKMGYG